MVLMVAYKGIIYRRGAVRFVEICAGGKLERARKRSIRRHSMVPDLLLC